MASRTLRPPAAGSGSRMLEALMCTGTPSALSLISSAGRSRKRPRSSTSARNSSKGLRRTSASAPEPRRSTQAGPKRAR